MERAINVFEWDCYNAFDDVIAPDGRERYLILLTDGNPYPNKKENPCYHCNVRVSSSCKLYIDRNQRLRDNIQSLGIKVRVVGIGDKVGIPPS